MSFCGRMGWSKPVSWKVSIYRPARSQSQNALFHIGAVKCQSISLSQGDLFKIMQEKEEEFWAR